MKMNPFKVGDKIKCYDHYADNQGVYTVIAVQKDYINFQGKDLQGQFSVHYKTCELVKEPREFWLLRHKLGGYNAFETSNIAENLVKVSDAFEPHITKVREVIE
jgi:hypothetical protein